MKLRLKFWEPISSSLLLMVFLVEIVVALLTHFWSVFISQNCANYFSSVWNYFMLQSLAMMESFKSICNGGEVNVLVGMVSYKTLMYSEFGACLFCLCWSISCLCVSSNDAKSVPLKIFLLDHMLLTWKPDIMFWWVVADG